MSRRFVRLRRLTSLPLAATLLFGATPAVQADSGNCNCGNGKPCLANQMYFGYYPTVWRRWPGTCPEPEMATSNAANSQMPPVEPPPPKLEFETKSNPDSGTSPGGSSAPNTVPSNSGSFLPPTRIRPDEAQLAPASPSFHLTVPADNQSGSAAEQASPPPDPQAQSTPNQLGQIPAGHYPRLAATAPDSQPDPVSQSAQASPTALASQPPQGNWPPASGAVRAFATSAPANSSPAIDIAPAASSEPPSNPFRSHAPSGNAPAPNRLPETQTSAQAPVHSFLNQQAHAEIDSAVATPFDKEKLPPATLPAGAIAAANTPATLSARGATLRGTDAIVLPSASPAMRATAIANSNVRPSNNPANNRNGYPNGSAIAAPMVVEDLGRSKLSNINPLAIDDTLHGETQPALARLPGDNRLGKGQVEISDEPAPTEFSDPRAASQQPLAAANSQANPQMNSAAAARGVVQTNYAVRAPSGETEGLSAVDPIAVSRSLSNPTAASAIRSLPPMTNPPLAGRGSYPPARKPIGSAVAYAGAPDAANFPTTNYPAISFQPAAAPQNLSSNAVSNAPVRPAANFGAANGTMASKAPAKNIPANAAAANARGWGAPADVTSPLTIDPNATPALVSPPSSVTNSAISSAGSSPWGASPRPAPITMPSAPRAGSAMPAAFAAPQPARGPQNVGSSYQAPQYPSLQNQGSQLQRSQYPQGQYRSLPAANADASNNGNPLRAMPAIESGDAILVPRPAETVSDGGQNPLR